MNYKKYLNTASLSQIVTKLTNIEWNLERRLSAWLYKMLIQTQKVFLFNIFVLNIPVLFSLKSTSSYGMVRVWEEINLCKWNHFFFWNINRSSYFCLLFFRTCHKILLIIYVGQHILIIVRIISFHTLHFKRNINLSSCLFYF